MQSVLVVDDDQIYRETLAQLFLKRGYPTRMASNVDQALSLVQQDCPQWVVVDLKMPGKNGLSFIQELLAFDAQTKIVMLTGYASVQTAVTAIKLGAVEYLSKPCDFDDILNAFHKSANSLEVNLQVEAETLEGIEEREIKVSLERNQGNISKAAKELGIHRRTLQRKLDKMK